MDNQQPAIIAGRYYLQRKLGEGGMAAVYLADDLIDKRQIALKLPFVPGAQMETTLKRLQREAQAAQSIAHPNVCQVYDVGEHEGRMYLAMQYIEGMSLADWIQRTLELPADRAAEIVATVARAVHAAHQAGILHRDLKTTNVMMTKDDVPIVTDFGMARWTEAQVTQLTPSGAMVGTPGYMAPEQIMAQTERIGPATDVYSLGVILYELVTGWMPFSGNLATVLGSVVSSPPPPLVTHCPGVDPRLEGICLKALAKTPEERFASAAELADALDAFRRGEPLTAFAVRQEPAAPAGSNPAAPTASPPETGLLGRLRNAVFGRK